MLENRWDMANYLLMAGIFDEEALLVVDPSNGYTALHYAAAAGKTDTMTTILSEALMDVDFPCKYEEETALHKAAEEGFYDAVDYLLDEGADMNKVCKYGQTAIIKAAANGCDKVCALLKSLGADYKSKDKFGRRAHHWAEENSHMDLALTL
jgi:ankyrin repeat protein